MSSASLLRSFACGLGIAVAVVSLGGQAAARPVPASEQVDRMDPLPERLRGIDVRERLNEVVPAGATFVDDQGRTVKLGDLLDGRRPVILTLNYSRCPMLCSLELNGLVASLKQVDWTAGKEFDIVTV